MDFFTLATSWYEVENDTICVQFTMGTDQQIPDGIQVTTKHVHREMYILPEFVELKKQLDRDNQEILNAYNLKRAKAIEMLKKVAQYLSFISADVTAESIANAIEGDSLNIEFKKSSV
jgi:hypothetical protein